MTESTMGDVESDLLLRLVGAFTVCRTGRVLNTVEVGHRRARRLLALLAVHAGRIVTTERIVDVLWGTSPPRRPGENVATLISRLRGALGVDVVAGDRRTGYRLGHNIRVDLHEAADLVGRAEAHLANHQPAHALTVVGRALSVVDGSTALTDESDTDWAEVARRLQAQLLRRARHTAATAALDIGDTRTAAAIAEAAVVADPFDEAAHRALMLAHHANGELAHALLTYERLHRTLADELGIDPTTTTRNLHLAILRNDLVIAAPSRRVPFRSV